MREEMSRGGFIALRGRKVYAVRKGVRPGIYSSWEECERQVKGFSGAEHRAFKSQEEAELYLGFRILNVSGFAR